MKRWRFKGSCLPQWAFQLWMPLCSKQVWSTSSACPVTCFLWDHAKGCMPDWKPSLCKPLLCDLALIQHCNMNNFLRKNVFYVNPACICFKSMFLKTYYDIQNKKYFKTKEWDFYSSLLRCFFRSGMVYMLNLARSKIKKKQLFSHYIYIWYSHISVALLFLVDVCFIIFHE